MDGEKCKVTPAAKDMMQTCSFWFEGTLLTGVGLVGLVGNLATVYVLSRPSMKNSFNHLLIALSCIDIIFIVFSILDYSFARVFFWPFPEESPVWLWVVPKFTYPLNNTSFCSSVFLTVVIAGERYLAICHPARYRNISITWSVSKRVLMYVVPVVFVSILLNVPKFFETELKFEKINPIEEYMPWLQQINNSVFPVDLFRNISYFTDEDESTKYRATLHLTWLRNHPLYVQLYTVLTRLLFTGILPIAALVFFNTKIFKGMRNQREISSRRAGSCSGKNSITIILICIVLTFLLCHFPRLLLNLFEYLIQGEECNSFIPPQWFHCLTCFSHLLLMINASVNFLIYCSLSSGFKSVIKTIVKNMLMGERREPNVNSTSRPISQRTRCSRRSGGERLPITPNDLIRPSYLSLSHTYTSTSTKTTLINDREFLLPSRFSTAPMEQSYASNLNGSLKSMSNNNICVPSHLIQVHQCSTVVSLRRSMSEPSTFSSNAFSSSRSSSLDLGDFNERRREPYLARAQRVGRAKFSKLRQNFRQVLSDTVVGSGSSSSDIVVNQDVKSSSTLSEARTPEVLYTETDIREVQRRLNRSSSETGESLVSKGKQMRSRSVVSESGIEF